MHVHTRDREERGAALVFVAISVVALLLVAALIIDGGFVRRFASEAASPV